jgi:hypothetical protein
MIEQFMTSSQPHAFVRQLRTSFQMRRWQWIGGLVCFLLINGYIAYRLYHDWHQLESLEWLRPDPVFLGITLVIQFIGLLIVIHNWRYILQQFGYQITFRRHFKVYTISTLARKIPGIGWDILSRVYMYHRDGGNKIQISVATMVEVVILGVSGIIVALGTLLLPGSRMDQVHPLLLVGVLLLFLVLIPSPLFRRFLTWINRGKTAELELRWHHMLNWALMNTLTITLGGISLFFFCRAFHAVDATAFVPLVQAWALTIVSGSLLTWLPTDIGVTSGVLVLILAMMMPMPQALMLLIAWRIWSTMSQLLWGSIGFVL